MKITKEFILHSPTSSAILEKLAESSTTPDKSGTLFYADGSHGNGCLMRIAPLGVLAAIRQYSVDELRANVLNATRCTHCHVEALDVCLVHCAVIQRLFTMRPIQQQREDVNFRMVDEANNLFAVIESIVNTLSTVAYVREKFAILKKELPGLIQQTMEFLENNDDNRAKLRTVDKAFFQQIISNCPVIELSVYFQLLSDFKIVSF